MEADATGADAGAAGADAAGAAGADAAGADAAGAGAASSPSFFLSFLGTALCGLLPFAGIAIMSFSPRILATLVVG